MALRIPFLTVKNAGESTIYPRPIHPTCVLALAWIFSGYAYPVYSARFAFNHTGLEARFQGFGSRMMVRSGDSRLLLPVASEGTTREQEAI